MTSIITGNGLGTFNTSLNLLGNAGPNGNPTLGKLGDKLYVNAADGNLVIQHQDDYLAATGLGVAFIRTYNSQGLMTGGGGTNWRFNVQDQLYSLTGTINTAGSTITRINDDGSESLYTYDSTTGHYTNTDGAGAYNTLSFNTTSNIWTWTNGSTQGTQTYNSAGQLLTNQDANGNTTTYGYTGLLLTQITDASGQATYFDYTGNNLSDIRTLSNGVTQTRTRYTYDTANRLSQVIVDLTPADNSIIDGKVYTTTYTYDGTSTRVASITQGDGTRISFTYDVQGRVTSYTDGVGNTTQLHYAATTAQTITVNSNIAALSTTDTQITTTNYGVSSTALLTTDTQTTTITVPAYYLVKASDTWASIAQLLYGTSDPTAISQLQTAL